MKVLAAGNALVRTLGAGPDTSPAQAIVVEGGDPETYASIAALVTASEGSLAAGYYQVTAGVPVTHPQYPRVLTYWDGATFEPQISTGWEFRPTLPGEYCVWDALENQFRARPAVDQLVNYLANALDPAATAGMFGVSGSRMDTYFRNAECEISEDDTSQSNRFRYQSGDLKPTEGTIILSGSDLGSAGGANTAIAAVGSTTTSRGFAIFNRLSSANVWGIGWWAASDASAVAPRAAGDVVILGYSATGYDFWVNGVKILTRNSGISVDTLPRDALILGDNGGTFSTQGGTISFAGFADQQIDDAGAAAWYAWLRPRYSIPVL